VLFRRTVDRATRANAGEWGQKVGRKREASKEGARRGGGEKERHYEDRVWEKEKECVPAAPTGRENVCVLFAVSWASTTHDKEQVQVASPAHNAPRVLCSANAHWPPMVHRNVFTHL